MPPMGLPLQMWGLLQPKKKVVTYLQEPPSLANSGTVASQPQLLLLDQIWDSSLGKEGAEVLSPPRDARNVTVPHRGWHRYTR